MSEQATQQNNQEQQPEKLNREIANPLELLKTSSDKLAKFGGFELFEEGQNESRHTQR